MISPHVGKLDLFISFNLPLLLFFMLDRVGHFQEQRPSMTGTALLLVMPPLSSLLRIPSAAAMASAARSPWAAMEDNRLERGTGSQRPVCHLVETMDPLVPASPTPCRAVLTT